MFVWCIICFAVLALFDRGKLRTVGRHGKGYETSFFFFFLSLSANSLSLSLSGIVVRWWMCMFTVNEKSLKVWCCFSGEGEMSKRMDNVSRKNDKCRESLLCGNGNWSSQFNNSLEGWGWCHYIHIFINNHI